MTLRALFAAGLAATAVGLAGCSDAGGSAEGRTAFEAADDRAKGSADAPVTMIEYASVACPGCASFHLQAMPTVYQHVDDGDVRFIFREMITGQPNLAVRGFMLANCAPEDQYFDVIDVLFEQQQALFVALQQRRGDAQMQTIARSVGFSDEEYRACMSDQSGIEGVQERNAAAAEAGISSTPTFIFNGEQLERMSAEDQLVYGVDGQPLRDEQGLIPATFEGETFSRIILYYKNRAEGGATDGGAQ